MNKLFTRTEMIPLILILAFGGLGFGLGANETGAAFMTPLAVVLSGMALL
jgi:hypothetical protein